MARNISFRDFDWLLVGFILTICALGVIEIRSATLHTKFAGVHIKQLYWIAGGLIGMFVVSLMNYHVLLERVHWMYIAALASLMVVLLFGQKYLGAKRWVKLPGGNHFQPSEWVKLILILAVAKYFSDLQDRELSWSDFMKAGAIVGIPMLMVLKQPDLGTALTYLPIAIVGLFLGGVRWKQALIVVLLAGLAMPLAWHHMKDYQKQRLVSFKDPDSDPRGAGYHVAQSLIAVGSGGIWGSSSGSQT
ncbi:MAG TPA: FtsW/RodA/SpoVE family cell cycle protein, partial [Terriglobales bacterium]